MEFKTARTSQEKSNKSGSDAGEYKKCKASNLRKPKTLKTPKQIKKARTNLKKKSRHSRTRQQNITHILERLNNIDPRDHILTIQTIEHLHKLIFHNKNANVFVGNGGLNCLANIILLICNNKHDLSPSEISIVSITVRVIGKLLFNPKVAQDFAGKGGLQLFNDIMTHFDHYEMIINAFVAALGQLRATRTGRQCMLRSGVVETAIGVIYKYPQYHALMGTFCDNNLAPVLIGLPTIVEQKQEKKSANLKVLNDLTKLKQQLSNQTMAYKFIKRGNVECILEIIQKYCGDAKIICMALGVISNCAKVRMNGIFAEIEEIGVCECTIQCMQQHPHNLDVQYNGLLALMALSQHNDSNVVVCLGQTFVLKAAVSAAEKAVGNDETCTRSTAMVEIFCSLVGYLFDEDRNENVEKTRREFLDVGAGELLNKILSFCPGHKQAAVALDLINPYRNFHPFGEAVDSDDDLEDIEDGIIYEYSLEDLLPENMGKISSSEDSFGSIDNIFIEEINAENIKC